MQSDGNNRPLESPVDLRERSYPPIGFVVDGAIATATSLAFIPHDNDTSVRVAHTESSAGISMVIVQRSRVHVKTGIPRLNRTIETLRQLGVHQVVAISHRLLFAPQATDLGQFGLTDDSLTIGVMSNEACSRLLSATFNRIEANTSTNVVFLREQSSVIEEILDAEGQAARVNGFCVCLVEASTLHTDPALHTQMLANLLWEIPDAVSPLASCNCRALSDLPL